MVARSIAGRLAASLGLVLITANSLVAQEAAHEGGNRWSVAGEAVRWTLDADGAEDVLDSKSLLVRWHPRSFDDFHLLGGIGLMSYRFGYDRDDPEGRSIGPTFGIGYDFHFPGELAVVPRVRWIAGTVGDGSLESATRRGRVATSLVQMGVGLVWRF